MTLSTFPNQTGLVVNLRFLAQTQFSLNHEMAVDAFMRHILGLGEDYSKHIHIATPENGRLHYREHDTYRFIVIMLGDKAALNPIWKKLITTLQSLPASAPVIDKKAPLRDNVKLIGLLDYFDGKPLNSEKSLDEYTLQRAYQQGQSWHTSLHLQASDGAHQKKKHTQTATLHFTWQSTVRLLKANHKEYTLEQRYCREAHHLTPAVLLKRLYETLSNITANFGCLPSAEVTKNHLQWIEEQSEFIEISMPDLYWIDTPYFSKNKSENTLGGMAGNLNLTLKTGIDSDLIGLLILGQTIGIGQRRASGLGKYRLKHHLNKASLSYGIQSTNIYRHQSLLEHAMQPHIIQRAINETEQKPNIDHLTDRTHAQIKSAIGQIQRHTYHAPSLKGFGIPKSNGEERLLAVSPLYDRILQKAVAIVLTPGLDAIMSQSSYGYRKGLSRQQVRYQIQNAYREGYKWVYESDIDDFFDSIDRKQLLNRLQSLYGKDPLWSLIDNWLGQPIHYKNTQINRPKGLPQGSPLSPLLANFILDDFDSDLEMHGFKLIRYADDFVILCKTQHQAQQAAKQVKLSLLELNLSLNADKTHIIELSQGFQFLGYLFRNDHAIEIGGKTADGRKSYSSNNAPHVLPSWLANIGTKTTHLIPDEDLPKHSLGEIESQGIHLVLAGDAQMLTTDNHNIIVKKDKKITHKISWEQLHAITLIGLHHMTLPAQHQALKSKIPVHLADRTGTYLGALTSFTPAQNNYKHWFIQLQMSDTPSYALEFSKQIVISRIHNQRKTIKRRATKADKLLRIQVTLKQLQIKVGLATNLNSLNGLEGQATKQYFSMFNSQLPKWAHFKKRTRRPPTDPFNVLLSLGYTILYTHVDSILQSAGFMTWKGIYHQQSPAHAALASDIMESYRHMIERNAIQQINQASIKEADFRQEKNELGQTQLRLSAEARRRYVVSIIKRFQKFSKTHTLHQHLYEQAQKLQLSMYQQQPFKPWKEQK